MPKARKRNNVTKYSPFPVRVLIATLSGVTSTAVVHPLDIVKTRIQVYGQPLNSLTYMFTIFKLNGTKSLYRGLSAGILRQCVNTPVRLSVTHELNLLYQRKYNRRPQLKEIIGIGAAAGLIGAVVGTPTEVALINLVLDSNYVYPRYGGVFDIIAKKFQSDRIKGLWTGVVSTSVRSVLLSVSQIATYSQTRKFLTEKKKGSSFMATLYSSSIAGFVSSLVTLPVDHVKSRYQAQPKGDTPYIIMYKAVKSNEAGSLWMGFTPYCLRMTIHTMITFFLMEELTNVYIRNFKRYRTI